jgi:shikimate kinase
MNIVLIGYRGCGKSSIAQKLEQSLGWGRISTDEEICRREKRTIVEMVERFGWEYFRDRESALCVELATLDNTIIDTGGGLILRPQNVALLKTKGTLFWLTAEVATICTRLRGDTQRPSLSGTKSFIEEIEEILQARLPHYQSAADHLIPTDDKSPEYIAHIILTKLHGPPP